MLIRNTGQARPSPDTAGEEAGLTDGQLLERYVSRREEAALAALVRRHAPLVWGVLRRVLRDYQDAEDAFQTTFLVLVRKAADILPRELVANWLYGVTYRTARKARATAAKRRARERQVTIMPERGAEPRDLWAELRPLLDQELSRLADKYRVAVVLCDLEGKTRAEAARQLGLPEGTVGSRLARGRALLARRLVRHGFAVSAGALAALLARQTSSAAVPAAVVSSTIQAATLAGAGKRPGPGTATCRRTAPRLRGQHLRRRRPHHGPPARRGAAALLRGGPRHRGEARGRRRQRPADPPQGRQGRVLHHHHQAG
jgi:RNA polymerase sigma factor (sigma-70 family)